MASLDACIIEKCTSSWDEEFIAGTKNSQNCSGFVKAVAGKLGIPLPHAARADGICDEMKDDASHWSPVADGTEAARLASTGKLVVAALKAADHHPPRTEGQVAIVVSGDLYRKKYPPVWCGSTGGAQSKGTKSVGEVWNTKDRDSVKYFAYSTAVCAA